MPEDLGDRTETPSHRRLSDARERGQIARSQDLTAALVLLAGALTLVYFGAGLVRGLGDMIRREIQTGALHPAADIATLTDLAWRTTLSAGALVAPLILGIAALAYVAHFLQVGWLVSAQALHPSWSKLNVLKGIGQLLSRRNAVKAAVNVVKLIVIAIIAWNVIGPRAGEIVALPLLSPVQGFLVIGEMLFRLAMWLLLFLLLLGGADYLYQRWQRTQDLKMTKQEVKDERRSAEGDPDVKARRMRIARQIALQRLRSDVPKADVVVTNPTHFAVALKYEPGRMRAPKVVAKGADHLAFQIRHIAVTHGVPILERPALARALYHGVEIGREIPQEHFEAVAEVLAYVYRLEGRRAV